MPDPLDKPALTAAAICDRHGNDPARLIEILHDLQDTCGLVADETLPAIAAALNLSRAEVHGVASFYHDFRRSAPGRVVARICRAESCQAMGARALIDDVCARHGIALGGTSTEGLTVEAVYCLGNCALSPAATVDGRLHGRLDAARLEALLAEALA